MYLQVTAPAPINADDVDAAYWAELRRLDNLELRQVLFADKYTDALDAINAQPLEDQGACFDEYWQGEGEFDGIHYQIWYYKSWKYDDEG